MFSTSGDVFYFALLLGSTGFLIGCFLIIEVSGVFFILFLRVIQIVSCVTLDKRSPCAEKTETLKLSL